MWYNDFPYWLRFAHFINLIFLTLLIRSGIEILSAMPKLYWHDHATPGTEWIKFTKKVFPSDIKERIWISLEEEESFSSWIALPGHKNLGIGRFWHFFSIIFWIANGAAYYILLFTSDEWQRLIPTSWSILPGAIHTGLMYLSLHFPPTNPYDPIQKLSYFAVVFILGPFMIATGAAMSPAIGARFPRYPKIFRGRQVARSLHFLAMCLFVLFLIAHISMNIIDGFTDNMGNMFLGRPTNFSAAIGILAFFVGVVVVVHFLATWISLKKPRLIQNTLGAVIEVVRRALFVRIVPRQNYPKADVTPFFRVNGYPPDTQEYKDLLENDFVNWRLKVHGLVEKALELSLEELRAMKKEVQITEHSCIQGWTAIGEWGGVPMNHILSLCRPLPQARYVIFYSYQYIKGVQFYEAINMELAKHYQTILAYEMNGEPLPVPHGAPLRLRVETQLGFKMTKWISSIECVSDYKHIGLGQGGQREDRMYYGRGGDIEI
jgi:methionine sulfoxide reductase catalytic subunit